MPVLPKKGGSQKAVSGEQDILQTVERALEKQTIDAVMPVSAMPDQMEFILRNVDDGITIQDAKTGSVTYANEIAARLCGFGSVVEFLKTPVAETMQRFEMMNEEGYPLPLDQLPGRKAMRGEFPEPLTVRFRVKATGEERWSVLESKPMFDASGNLQSILNVFHDVTDQKRGEREAAFLAKATTVLGSTLDYHTVLQNIATLTVPGLADWCGVTLREEDGTLHSVAAAHKDPAKVEWAKQIAVRYPTNYNRPQGVGQVIRSGKSELYEEIGEEMILAAAQDEEHLRLIRELGMCSAMIVPIVSRKKTLGAISFIFSESHRRFSSHDLAFAEDFGKRIGMAIDNARLYRAAQHEIEDRKKAEEALRLSEARYERAALAGSTGIWDWDIRSDSLFLAPNLKTLLGYSPEEIPDTVEAWNALIHPDDLYRVMNIAEKHIHGATPAFEAEVRRRHKNGEYRWFLTRGTVVRDSTGMPFRMTGSDTDITERKRAEEGLKRSEDRYRAFIRQSSEGIWRFELEEPIDTRLSEDEQIDACFKYAYLAECNDAMAKMYGYDFAKEITGARLGDMLMREDPKNIEYLRAFIRSGYNLREAESHEVDKNGEEKYFVNNLVGTVESGKVIHAWGMQRDITLRKKTEDALRESEMRFRVMADSAPVLIWMSGINKEGIFFNKTWLDFTGRTLEEEMGEGWLQSVHSEDMPALAACAKAFEDHTAFTTQFRMRRNDGTYRWILDTGVPRFDAGGNFQGFIGSCVDITAHKEVEQTVMHLNEKLEQRVAERTHELHEANRKLTQEIAERERAEEHDRANIERLRSIIDSIPLGAIMTDQHLKVIHANDRFCDLFDMHCHAPGLMGKAGPDVIAAAVRGVMYPREYTERVNRTLTLGEPDLNQEVLMKDGRVLSRDYLPIIVNGARRGHLLLYRDITQERRVDAAKSEFMSLASHQLRTPLTAIRWSFGRLNKSLSGKTSDLDNRVLQEGHREAVRMAETIDTMLAISRIEAGKVRLMQSETTLAGLLEEARMRFQDQYRRKEQVFEIRCDPDVRLSTDPGLLKEILHNLVSNAIKYTPPGGSITITGRQNDHDVWIEVSDTGYGIPAHQQDQIFNKFFRGDNVLDKETDGTGLGLYLVSLLMTLLGGTISFESSEERGTVFRLLFPISSPSSHA